MSSYSSSNNIEGSFPFSDGVLRIQATDQKGSYSNIQRQLNVTQIVLNCSQINIQQYTLRYQISLLLEIVLNHQDQQNCIDFSKQLYPNIKTFLDAEDNNDQLLVYQTVKLYKRIIRNHNNLNSSKRLLNDNLESCFENSTKSFYFQSAPLHTSSNFPASSLLVELQYMMNTVQKIIAKLTDIQDQISQNDIFLNEKLYQSKVAALESLLVAQLLIDDIFLMIPMATINSNFDKEQIINVAEGLISLFDQILTFTNVQVKVNGPGKSQQIIFYPGNFAIFKNYFKFIHEVLSWLSIKISIFILVTFLQITQIDLYPLFIILLVNCGIYLLIRMILKIFQSIYRFGGKCSNSIVIFYLPIHFLCYLGLVLQMKQCQTDIQIINFEVSLITIGSLFQFYFILEPTMVFSRIFLFSLIAMQSRYQIITPLNQLIYFFVQHKTLDQHLNNY